MGIYEPLGDGIEVGLCLHAVIGSHAIHVILEELLLRVVRVNETRAFVVVS